ncbi:MAG: hypothetical protein AAF561_12560 [Planctomycetota bacterium]
MPGVINVHGHLVALQIDHPVVARPAVRLLRSLADEDAPFRPTIFGEVLDYDADDVTRRLSDDARPVRPGESAFHPLTELFRTDSGDRWYVVDERWGIAEVDLIRGSWRSFVLRNPSLEAVRLFEAAVWWPMAQLLRSKGLHLLPASSFVIGRHGDRRGALLLGPTDVVPEVSAWVARGARIISQRWTALRLERGGDTSLLSMPGMTPVRDAHRPLMRGDADDADSAWIDLCPQPAATCRCDTILIADGPRRRRASMIPLSPKEGEILLRQHWPIPHLGNVTNALPQHLARLSPIHRVRLDRRGEGFAHLMLGEPMGPTSRQPNVATPPASPRARAA